MTTSVWSAGDGSSIDAGMDTTATVLVGRYTPPDGVRGVQRFRVSDEGAVREAQVALLSPSWLIRARGLVFAACEAAQSRVAALREDADCLTVVSSVDTGGADACHLAESPDGRWLAVALYTSGSIRLLELPADGQLDGALRGLLRLEGSGPDPNRQTMPHAHQITWLDASHFLCCDLGTDSIRVVEVDDDGTLTLLDPIVLPAGFGPRHLVLRGHQLAVVGELSGELASLRHEGDRVDAGWSLVDIVPGTAKQAHNQPSGLVAFGDDLVVGNRVVDTIARFSWPADGRLELRYESSCGGAMPRDVAVRDDEVWVALQEGSAVVVHRALDDGFVELARFPVEGAARVLF